MFYLGTEIHMNYTYTQQKISSLNLNYGEMCLNAEDDSIVCHVMYRSIFLSNRATTVAFSLFIITLLISI